MSNKSLAVRFYDTFFGAEIDYREKMLHMLAIVGIIAGIVMGVFNTINANGLTGVLRGFTISAFSFGILVFVITTKRYTIGNIITIFAVFLGYFPYIFLTMGGFYSGKAINFIFAIVFTAYVLKGKLGAFMIALQTLVFTGVNIYAYLFPENITPLPTSFNYMLDTVTTALFTALTVSIVFILHIRMYNRQKGVLDQQNSLLAGISLSKTQFLANTSHEMRTPLTVMSVSVQNAIDMLTDMQHQDPELIKMLDDTQNEIMRLSRMVSGMLTLTSVSEAVDKRKLNISDFLHALVDTLGLHIRERGNTLKIISSGECIVFGDADLIYQTIVNLINNADKHTTNDTITISASRKESNILITISDNGTGIPPELLPHVFERGVTDGKGTGYGLFLCKMIVESHNGEIWIESTLNKGTSIHISLPCYEGQFEGGSK